MNPWSVACLAGHWPLATDHYLEQAMPFPLPTNTTCDIYRGGVLATAGVGITLQPRFRNIKPVTAAPTNIRYTHIAYAPLGADVRDGWPNSGGGDTLYVPSFNDPKYQDYTVVFVERTWFGADRSRDYKTVYLQMNDQQPRESDNC
jgi:hypothetical protein